MIDNFLVRTPPLGSVPETGDVVSIIIYGAGRSRIARIVDVSKRGTRIRFQFIESDVRPGDFVSRRAGFTMIEYDRESLSHRKPTSRVLSVSWNSRRGKYYMVGVCALAESLPISTTNEEGF